MTLPRYGQRRDPIVPNAPSATPSARPVSAETQRLIDRAKERAKPPPVPAPQPSSYVGLGTYAPEPRDTRSFGDRAFSIFDTVGRIAMLGGEVHGKTGEQGIGGALFDFGQEFSPIAGLTKDKFFDESLLQQFGAVAAFTGTSGLATTRAPLSASQGLRLAGLNLGEAVGPTTALGRAVRAPAYAAMGVMPPPGGSKVIRYSDDIPPGRGGVPPIN